MLGVPTDQVTISAFAGAVKDEVAILYGIPRAELDTDAGKNRLIRVEHERVCSVRDLLISHGEGEKQRAGDPAVWTYRVSPGSECRHWIFSDWRFPAEYAAVRQRFPNARVHTVNIERPSVGILDTYTEHELDKVQCSAILENSGSLLYLRRQVQDLVFDVLQGAELRT